MRSTRTGLLLCRLISMVSVSAASSTACFMFQCTPDSSDDSIRVPICTPSAPSANAAAIERPSAIPPAATIGTSSFDAISGSSTIDGDVARVLEPGALAALDDEAVDAGVDGALGALQRRHDVEHDQPGLLEHRPVLVRRAGRRGDELDALVDDHVRRSPGRAGTPAAG